MDPASARILVVDDIEDNRYTLGMFLELEGYTNVTMATDGREALERIAAQPFDLVLLDVMMPNLNGIEVLERLKAEDRLHRLPVIMISAQQELESVVRSIELGAEDYLPKPFNQTLLAARLRASLEKKALRDLATAHAERMEHELATARALQLAMMPGAIADPAIDACGVLEPARELGGDFYDWFPATAGTLCFAVGDVCDKGVAAALFMARAMNTIRLIATGGGDDPSAWLAAANTELCRDNASCMYVALMFGVFRPAAGTVLLCNAGGVDPWRIGPDGRAERIAIERSRPLGVRGDERYAMREFALAPGAALALFTDGVTEAANAAGELYGDARVAELFAGTPNSGAAGLCNAAIERLHAFVGDAPRADDVALVVVRNPG